MALQATLAFVFGTKLLVYNEYFGLKLAQSSPRKEDLRNDTFGHNFSKPFSCPDSEKGSLANETYLQTNLMLIVPKNATSLWNDTWMYLKSIEE